MLLQGDAAAIPLPDKSVHAVVTSPPYWGLRKYQGEQGRGMFPNLGLEKTPELYIQHIVEIFREVRRVLRDDGTVWLNYGDCYAGSGGENANTGLGSGDRSGLYRNNPRRTKIAQGNLMMMPHRVSIALQDAGWIVRNDCVWWKRNPMPESVSGWSFVRHRVRISHHAHLSNLSKENGDSEDGRSDLPIMSGCEEITETTRVSEDRSGSRSKSQVRPKRKSKDVGKEIQTIGEGSSHTEDSKAKALRRKPRKISGAMARMEQNASESSRPEALRGKQKGQEKESGGSRAIQTIPEGIGVGIQEWSEKAQESIPDRLHIDGDGMERNQNSSQPPMLLLQAQDGATDEGSCDTVGQGGQAHQGERSTSVSELQQQEGQEALATVLVDCPGCEKCNPHNGYILKKGSFRHTRAHEFVFQLVKKMNYYSNQEAVREMHSPKSFTVHTTPRKGTGVESKGEKFNLWLEQDGRGRQLNPAGRNPRSVLDVPTQSYKGSHYATFPERLIAPLIRASCPKRCCPECGAPWAPVVEKKEQLEIGRKTQGLGPKTIASDKSKLHYDQTSNIIDYRPTCSCDCGDHIPGICLDPFIGSGTTGAVARELGRRWIGLDISMEYLDQQAKIRALNWTPSNALDGLPLFEEMP